MAPRSQVRAVDQCLGRHVQRPSRRGPRWQATLSTIAMMRRRDLNDAHERDGGEIEHEPRAGHAREERAPTREATPLRWQATRGAAPRSTTARRHEPSIVHPTRAPSSKASVAPNVRMNPASRTSSGLATVITAAATDSGLPRATAVVHRARRRNTARHQRGAPHGRPGVTTSA